MKKITLFLLLLAYPIMYAQENKTQPETKMEVFLSKTGVMRKFIDYKIEPIKSSYETTETRVRKVIVGNESKYFFQIDKPSKYSNSIASIEYSDLLEVIKALSTLKGALESDIALTPDYLENKFVTTDGFQVGYYVSKSKPKWYVKLEKYGSDNTIYLDDITPFENICISAKNKIEEFKK